MRNADDIDMKLVANWKATGKLPSNKKIIEALWVVQTYHDGAEEIPVHRDLIELIGHKLVGPIA